MDTNVWFDIAELLNDDLDYQNLFSNLNEIPDSVDANDANIEAELDGLLNIATNGIISENEECIDFDVPDLSDLPLEDFIDLENLVDELDSSAQNCLINDDQNDEFFQNSPVFDEKAQLAYKELLDVFDEENLIYSLLNETPSPPSVVHCEETESSVEDASVCSVADTDSTSSSEIFTTVNNISNDEKICATQETDVTSEIIKLLQEQYGISLDVNASEEKVNEKSNKRKIVINKKFENEEQCKKIKYDTAFIDNVDKTTQRRIKNNEASKVTRARRKAKHQQLFEKEKELEKHNAELKIKIESMQKEATALRDLLISKLSSVKVEAK